MPVVKKKGENCLKLRTLKTCRRRRAQKMEQRTAGRDEITITGNRGSREKVEGCRWRISVQRQM